MPDALTTDKRHKDLEKGAARYARLTIATAVGVVGCWIAAAATLDIRPFLVGLVLILPLLAFAGICGSAATKLKEIDHA